MSLCDALPVYSADLIRMLHEEIPHRCPRPGEDAEAIQRYAGKRDLIDLLISKLEDIDDERETITGMNWLEGGR